MLFFFPPCSRWPFTSVIKMSSCCLLAWLSTHLEVSLNCWSNVLINWKWKKAVLVFAGWKMYDIDSRSHRIVSYEIRFVCVSLHTCMQVTILKLRYWCGLSTPLRYQVVAWPALYLNSDPFYQVQLKRIITDHSPSYAMYSQLRSALSVAVLQLPRYNLKGVHSQCSMAAVLEI